MLTKKQIYEIARKNNIGAYYQEKDYLLNIFLNALYKEEKNILFKGGTCLKLVYNYPRFSEDLDFDTKIKPEEIKTIIRKVLDAFVFMGIRNELVKEELFEKSYTVKIRFFGPLYSGKSNTTNTISVDIGARGKIHLKSNWKQINSVYSDIPIFFVLAMNEKEVLAEKIRALFMRAKPRDLFDIWCMLNNGVDIDKKLFAEKLKEANIKPNHVIKFPEKKEYTRDLSNLLSNLPSYEQVREEVNRAVREQLI